MPQNLQNIPNKDFSFSKKEKLCNVKEIENLFESGNAMLVYPIKVVYIKKEIDVEKPINQVGFSVSKRRFKSAVKRNKIKRLMREAYRLNKHLLEGKIAPINCFFIYVGDKTLEFRTVQNAMIKVLKRINQNLSDD